MPSPLHKKMHVISTIYKMTAVAETSGKEKVAYCPAAAT